MSSILLCNLLFWLFVSLDILLFGLTENTKVINEFGIKRHLSILWFELKWSVLEEKSIIALWMKTQLKRRIVE